MVYILYIYKLLLYYAYINEGCINVVICRLTEWLQYNTIIIIYIKRFSKGELIQLCNILACTFYFIHV